MFKRKVIENSKENSIYNHSNFVNYYFIIKFLIGTFIKIYEEQFYVIF